MNKLSYSQQIQVIKEKFVLAKAIDTEYKVFDSSAHQYRLGAVVSEEEVLEFEEKYAISLPQCYRTFITEFSGFSAVKPKRNKRDEYIPAPHYGLFSFERIFDESSSREEFISSVKEPCTIYPYISHKEWKDLDIEGFDGLLPLGEQGCTYISALVLNGKYKGRVVYLDLDYAKPFFTYEDNFLDWYERWLDEIIDKTLLQKEFYGFGTFMKGDEKSLLKKLEREKSTRIQGFILSSFWKFKNLDDSTIKALLPLLSSSDNSLYLDTVRLISHHKYNLMKEELEKMIQTSEEFCQEACNSILLYAKNDICYWEEILIRQLKMIKQRNTFNKMTLILDEIGYDYSKDIKPLQNKNKDFKTLVPYTLKRVEGKNLFVKIGYFYKKLWRKIW